MKYCIINCTVSAKEEALKIAKELVDSKLIACCNIIPNIISVYNWNNKLQEDNEVLMIIKTKAELFENVKQKILELHSYEVPEIIKIPIDEGSEDYLNWIDNQTLKGSL